MNKPNYFFILFILLFFVASSFSYANDEITLANKSTSNDASSSESEEEDEGEEEGVEGNMEEFVLDSAAVDASYKHLIPANDLYAGIWSNQMVNPYNNILLDSVLNDSISNAINMNGFHFPLKVFYRVTSNFGQRRRRYHYGVDLKIQRGDTVVSVTDGMVRVAKTAKGYGNFILIRHTNGLETVYGHLDDIKVEPNQIVKAGEIIGLAGNTGRSTGPHLHFEFRFLGRPINPSDLIDFDSTLQVNADTLRLTESHFKYPKKTSRIAYTAHRPIGNDLVTVAENPYPAPLAYTPPKRSRNNDNSIKPATNMKSNGTWVVKSGDTLGHIATRTGASISRLCALNGINKTKMLRIGQKVLY